MKNLILFLLIGISTVAFSQNEYQQDFEFNEGLYQNFNDFKQNNTIIPEGLMKKGEGFIVYNDSLKKAFELDPDKVWGYSTGRGVYVSIEGDFSRLNLIGRYSQFAAYVVTTTYSYDPYGFQTPRESRTLVQFLLNFENGKMLPFNERNFEPILQKDPQLWKEYRNTKGKKEMKIFLFLRKYNEKYPISFPD